MLAKIPAYPAPFRLEGQFLGFVLKDGYKVKFLKLRTFDRELWIKIPKTLRDSLDQTMKVGSQLEVTGIGGICPKKRQLKLEAENISLFSRKTAPKAVCSGKILMCQKTNCQRRGGNGVYAALEESLRDRGLKDKVQIQGTGCLKGCKTSPNLVFLPDKTHYHQVTPQQVDSLIAHHFATRS